MVPPPAKIRHKVVPRDGTMTAAARKLNLTLEQFREVLPALYKRGFPKPDLTTFMFDLVAIDKWQDLRHPQVFTSQISGTAVDARTVVEERLARLERL